MAKKGRKKGSKKGSKKGGKKSEEKSEEKKGIEAVGWGFWLICFAVLFGPCYYLGYTISYSARKGGVLPWVIGFSLAAFGAGLLSFVLNFIVQKRIESRRKRGRKTK